MGSVSDHEDIDLEEYETSNLPDDLEEWKNLTKAEKVTRESEAEKVQQARPV